jgi:hypothetical protein
MNANATVVKSSLNRYNFLMIVVLFLLSYTGVNAQSVADSGKEGVEVLSTSSIKAVAALDTQIDFVGWFMGSNQNQSINESGETVDKATSTKKQIISSGIVPNRVLYKTLVKKVFVNAVV